VALGVLLLTAAGLKLYGRDVSAVPQVGWFSSPWVQVAAAGWEIVLGFWLLSGAARRFAWAASLSTFAAFAVVSGTLGWQGVADCGCFGTVHASPWWAFGVDVVALVLLAFTKPARQPSTPRSSLGITVGVAVSVVVVFLAAGTLVYGSPAAALARLRGDELYATPEAVSFGDGHAGDSLTAVVRVRNLSSRPVRLIGGTADCNCVTTSDLPLTVPAGGEQTVTVTLKLPQTGGTYTRVAALGLTASPNDHCGCC